MSSLDDSLIEMPPPPTEVNPKIPLRLSDLIMECIEVAPEDRPKTMQDILDVLEIVDEEIEEMHAMNKSADQPASE